MEILRVFTRAVVEAVDQNDEQESEAQDPGHDGAACSTYSTGEEKLDGYIPDRPCGPVEFDLWSDQSWQV